MRKMVKAKLVLLCVCEVGKKEQAVWCATVCDVLCNMLNLGMQLNVC